MTGLAAENVIIKQTSESLKKADRGEQIYAALVV